jgi:hypothetical protein
MIDYSLEIKAGRLAVVNAALAGGAIELGGPGMKPRLALVELEPVAGTVLLDRLEFNAFPKFGMAENAGTASAARLVARDGRIVASGLTVGGPGSGADIVLADTKVAGGNVVKLESAEIRHG